MSYIRISGGKHRNKRLVIPLLAGIRPAQSAVRSTLFNWYGNDLTNKRCLDLFAGTGILSWEVLSRGASHVTLVEQKPSACSNLRRQGQLLGYDRNHFSVLQRDVLRWLQKQKDSCQFDLIFLDPPYNTDYFLKCCQLLMQKGLIAPNGRIFYEIDRKASTGLPAIIEQQTQHIDSTLSYESSSPKTIYSLLKSAHRGNTYFGLIG